MYKVQQWAWLGLMMPLLFILLITPFTLTAQEDAHEPQFVYRDDNQLILLTLLYEGGTETKALPHIEADSYDKFQWSSDGQYLTRISRNDENDQGNCFNLYSLADFDWVYPQPISCNAGSVYFSPDHTQLLYTVQNETNGELRVFTISTQTDELLYQTEPTDSPVTLTFPCCVDWSPSGKYLYFEHRFQIMGGTVNTLEMMNYTTRERYSVSAPNGYYASYYPIWSPDEEWYLLILQEEYVKNGMFPFTNHRGDLYLIHAADGEIHRITYSPAEAENNPHWTESGEIAYSTHISYDVDTELSVTQAINVSEPDPASIITPEPYDESGFNWRPFNYPIEETGEGLGAWIDNQNGQGEHFSLRIVYATRDGGEWYEIFETTLDENERHDIVGWRPCPCTYSPG